MLLAVDPGLSACGCALFEGGRLVEARLVRNPASDSSPLAARVKCMAVAISEAFIPSELAIEFPLAYRKKLLQKGDQNDLLRLACVVGTILARLGVPSTTYLPFEWKRQLPKRITRARVRKRLEPAELRLVQLPAASLQHNVYDAIGIGLHHTGRVLF